MSETFACPNCGAPLDYTVSAGAAVRCPYCASTVIVPQTLRPVPSPQPAAAPEEPPPQVDPGELEEELRRLLQEGDRLAAIQRYREVFGEGLSEARDAIQAFENGEGLRVPIAWGQSSRLVQRDTESALEQVAHLARQGDRPAAVRAYRLAFDSSLQEAQTVVARLARDADSDPQWVVAKVRAGLAASRPVVESRPERKSRTVSCLYALIAAVVILSFLIPLLIGLAQAGGPLRRTWERINPVSFARLVSAFGGQGQGPGLFSDPRAIAVGADGSLYVGDYVDGRIQRFDGQGKFLNQWFTQEESYLASLAVDRTGQVYAAYRGEIVRFDGQSGVSLRPLPNPHGRNYDYVALSPQGGLVAVADGEDLVRIDSAGEVQWLVAEALSSVSGQAEPDTRLAVDGLGYIYALGTFNSAVFKFSPEGRFLNRWGSAGDQPGQFRAPSAIAVDAFGRLCVSDINGVQVFAGQDGRYLDRFEVPGVVFGLAFGADNNLYAVSNDRMVYRYRLQPPQPTVREFSPVAGLEGGR